MYGFRPRFSWITSTAGNLPRALAVLGDLLRPGIIGRQALQDRDGGQPADRELRGAVQKGAAVDLAVLVLVEDVEQLLRVVRRLFALHRRQFYA